MLKEVQMDDVPEDPMMSHIIKEVRRRIGDPGRTTPAAASGTTAAGADGGASMDMMALSSQSMVALLSKLQEGNDADRQRKESEKSILKRWARRSGLCSQPFALGVCHESLRCQSS
jgi:hypothetical protein